MTASPNNVEASPASIIIQRRIEWWDTDAAGHYHFLTAFRLFEAGEIALLSRLGLLDVTGRLPRLHVSADFRKVLNLNDLVDVYVGVEKVGNSSLGYRFKVHRQKDLCVEGQVVTALLQESQGRKMVWPDRAKRLLSSAGPQIGEVLNSRDADH